MHIFVKLGNAASLCQQISLCLPTVQMDWNTQQHVEACAPSHLVLPTGSKVPINYNSSISPTAAVKMQEVFGLADTPLLGGQQVHAPLVLELMSPAGKPLQVRGR